MTGLVHDAGGAGSGNGPAPLSHLPRWAVPAACLGLATTAVVALVASTIPSSGRRATTPRPPGPARAAAGSGRGAPTPGDAQAVLDRHGAAVRSRDRDAFLAGIDDSPAAAPYRRAQVAVFDNLARVPLAGWSYQVSAPVTGGSVLTDAAARYHAAVLIARVALSYQLPGVDPAPTEHDVWLTFTRRAGHVRIASDSDLAGEGGQSWRGPWDYGPVSVYHGASCLILAHPAYATRLAGLARVLDGAVRAVTAVWGAGWPRPVAVFVPAGQDELGALVGSPADPGVAAQTLGDPGDPRTGIRVVLDPDAWARLSDVGLRIVLRHEITHVAAWSVTTDQVPSWLVEGFADYVGNLDSGQPVGVAAAELRAQVLAGRLPAGLPASGDFADAGARLPQVYEQAWLACRLIATLAGTAGLVRVYRLVAASTGAPDAGVDHALRTVAHMTLVQFTAGWRQYLRTELAVRAQATSGRR